MDFSSLHAAMDASFSDRVASLNVAIYRHLDQLLKRPLAAVGLEWLNRQRLSLQELRLCNVIVGETLSRRRALAGISRKQFVADIGLSVGPLSNLLVDRTLNSLIGRGVIRKLRGRTRRANIWRLTLVDSLLEEADASPLLSELRELQSLAESEPGKDSRFAQSNPLLKGTDFTQSNPLRIRTEGQDLRSEPETHLRSEGDRHLRSRFRCASPKAPLLKDPVAVARDTPLKREPLGEGFQAASKQVHDLLKFHQHDSNADTATAEATA